jgi:hypothetical protein
MSVTYPPPEYNKGGIPEDIDEEFMKKCYSFLLLNLIVCMVWKMSLVMYNTDAKAYDKMMWERCTLIGDKLMAEYNKHPSSRIIYDALALVHDTTSVKKLPPFEDFIRQLLDSIN